MSDGYIRWLNRWDEAFKKYKRVNGFNQEFYWDNTKCLWHVQGQLDPDYEGYVLSGEGKTPYEAIEKMFEGVK